MYQVTQQGIPSFVLHDVRNVSTVLNLSYVVNRATGVAISMVAARLGGIIGNVVIATLLDTYCPAPTFIVAVLLAGGGLMCLFLPNTTRQALQ